MRKTTKMFKTVMSNLSAILLVCALTSFSHGQVPASPSRFGTGVPSRPAYQPSPVTSQPNVFGGQNYSNGITSQRNVFGGQNYSNGVTTQPNVFGGQNFSNGLSSQKNVFGGQNYSNGVTTQSNVFGGQNYSNGVTSQRNVFGGQNYTVPRTAKPSNGWSWFGK